MAVITVTCCGRTLRSYRRVDGDPPQWHLVPTAHERARGIGPDVPWWEDDGVAPTPHGSTVRLRCSACGFDAKHRLDRVYGVDFPPFSVVFERLRDNGIDEISARALDAVTEWPR